MITVTENAKSQAIRLMQEEGKAGYFIRVGVEGGGCSGLMYQLTFDNTQKDDDKVFEDNGIKVVVDKKSFLYLIGTTLDFLVVRMRKQKLNETLTNDYMELGLTHHLLITHTKGEQVISQRT